MQNSDFLVISDKKVPWILEISKVYDGFSKDLFDHFDRLSNSIRQQLKKRVRTKDEKIKIILEEFLFKPPPRKKTPSERIFDIDLSSGRFPLS